MTDLFPTFGLAAIIAAALASIAIWAPRRLLVRLLALGAAVLFLPIGYAALADLLSRPKPASLEWLRCQTAEAQVLGSSVDEGRAIYVWLRLPGEAEPRAYSLPWSRTQAEQLQQATRQAEAAGSGVVMRMPFERSLDDRTPRFYAPPQPAPPPKEQASSPAVRVMPRGGTG